MRVFVAGAIGGIATRLDRGHEVIGTSRSPENGERVRALRAEPFTLDLLDARAVRKAVLESEPDAIVHQATALTGVRFSKNLHRSFANATALGCHRNRQTLTHTRIERTHMSFQAYLDNIEAKTGTTHS
jgi:2-alkyl-3-oxoalkanoate reductase